eukprot:g5111.t1
MSFQSDSKAPKKSRELKLFHNELQDKEHDKPSLKVLHEVQAERLRAVLGRNLYDGATKWLHLVLRRRTLRKWIEDMDMATTVGDLELCNALFECLEPYTRVKELQRETLQLRIAKSINEEPVPFSYNGLVGLREPMYYESFLHRAVATGRSELVMKLLDVGADPQAVNGMGETPLHVSCRIGDSHLEISKMVFATAIQKHLKHSNISGGKRAYARKILTTLPVASTPKNTFYKCVRWDRLRDSEGLNVFEAAKLVHGTRSISTAMFLNECYEQFYVFDGIFGKTRTNVKLKNPLEYVDTTENILKIIGESVPESEAFKVLCEKVDKRSNQDGEENQPEIEKTKEDNVKAIINSHKQEKFHNFARKKSTDEKRKRQTEETFKQYVQKKKHFENIYEELWAVEDEKKLVEMHSRLKCKEKKRLEKRRQRAKEASARAKKRKEKEKQVVIEENEKIRHRLGKKRISETFQKRMLDLKKRES